MKQAVMVSPGHIEIHEVPVPEVGAQDVSICIQRIGICGSDIHVYHGKHPFTSYPVVQGHEVSGYICEKGEAVSDLRIGQKVTVRPQVVCGTCRQCRDGQYHICEHLKVMGFQTTGAASQYFVTHAANIIPLPDDLSYDAGTIVEPLAVGVHALRHVPEVQGKHVMILGAGTIGNLTAQAALAMGAQSAVVVDISSKRLAIAQQCGITYQVNSSDVYDPKIILQRIKQMVGDDGPDIICDCVGIQPTIQTAVAVARKGIPIVLVGVYPGEVLVDLSLVQDRELKLLGTLMYKEEDMIEALDMLNKGMIAYEPVITHHVPFEAYQQGYEIIEHQQDAAMKVLVDL